MKHGWNTEREPIVETHPCLIRGISIRIVIAQAEDSAGCGRRRRRRRDWGDLMRINKATVGLFLITLLASSADAQDLKPVPVDGQPLAGNARRLLQALDYLGTPLAADT